MHAEKPCMHHRLSFFPRKLTSDPRSFFKLDTALAQYISRLNIPIPFSI